MEVIKIVNGILKQDCYILKLDGKVFVIDPGLDTELILSTLEKKRLHADYVLLTHGHFDHIYSANKLKQLGAKVYITEVDAPKLFSNELNMGFLYGFECETCVPDGFLKEGENEIGDEKFEVVFTPGHTSGSCCIIYEDLIFTGDTYFEEGVYGRTDLLDGNQKMIEKSIEKLRPFLNGKTILAGHE